MGWEYLNSDKRLRHPDRFRMRISATAALGKPFRGIPYKDDSIPPIKGCGAGSVATPVLQDNMKWVDIEFQFPPKVLTDGRKGNWQENDMPGGGEQNAVFKTSGPRELTVATSYIVDSFDQNSESWSIDRITRNLRILRGYFANARDVTSNRDNLVIRIHMWCIGGDSWISARIRGIEIKYGDTMVFPASASDQAFPLRTDVTIDLRVWTRGMYDDKKIGAQDLKALIQKEPPSWY